MEGKLIEELIIFAGLMATLGSITKIVLSVINRRRPALKEAMLDEMAARLSRIEQAVDATAVEVERISEAQRFTTKLLVEKGHQAPVESQRGRIVTPH
jgi:PP-loop superfamily ATP-utilizing enzyme